MSKRPNGFLELEGCLFVGLPAAGIALAIFLPEDLKWIGLVVLALYGAWVLAGGVIEVFNLDGEKGRTHDDTGRDEPF